MTCTDCQSEIEPGRQGDVVLYDRYGWGFALTVSGDEPPQLSRGISVPCGPLRLVRPYCLPCTESHARAKGAWREEPTS